MRLHFIGSLLLMLLCAIPVHADMITVNFTQPTLIGVAGDTLTFGGTLLNTGSDVYINGVSITIAGFDPSALDSSPFLLNAPVTMAGGDFVGPFDFFTVMIPTGFADGSYDGTLTVQGGAGSGDDATLGSATFTAQVGPVAAPVPEPSTLLLLGSSLAGLGIVSRLRRRRTLDQDRS